MSMKKSTSVTFRLSDELKDVLGIIAESEVRSLSQQAEFFIKKGIAEYLEYHPDVSLKVSQRGLLVDE